MIGTRAGVSAGAAVVVVVAIMGRGGPDPAVTIGAERLVHERAAAAVRALGALRDSLQPGLDAARTAAAAVLSSEAPPGSEIGDAASLIADADAAADRARQALRTLDQARGAWRPGSPALPEPVATGELTSIATQLDAAAEPADAFRDLRRAATGLPSGLERALQALARGAVAEAADLTVQARADHSTIVGWETDLPSLPVWIDTTDAMITAVEEIVAATRAGDADAAARAARAFAALGDDAATADRALRIALGEAGSALTAAPLGRLATVLRAVDESRATASAIGEATER